MKAEEILDALYHGLPPIEWGADDDIRKHLKEAAAEIAAAHEQDKADALEVQNQAWQTIEADLNVQLLEREAQLTQMRGALTDSSYEVVDEHDEHWWTMPKKILDEILAAAPRKLLWLGTEGIIEHRISYTGIDGNTWVLEVEGERFGEDDEEGIQVMAFRLPEAEQADSTEQEE